MKVSINWLNEWIEVVDLDPKELADDLTMAGLEVDSIEYRGSGFDDIVVGQIVAIDEHPNADRLVVCQIDVGDSDDLRTIVCGATNMGEGDRVPVALPGSSPPGIDFDIGAREVMGVASQGMLCSQQELDLAEESEGLMILDAELKLGRPFYEALDLQDVILEIDLTPNRSDCLSHLGVAREVAAIYGRSLRPERLESPLPSGDSGRPIDEVAELKVVDEDGCPHYRMAVLENVEVAESPQWLQRRLASVGLRSVNSVVDVTNYVLMDVGQPLHAFDLDLLDEAKIVVRRAKEGETLLGIDHSEYKLESDDLVIADASRPVALAGVMGGADTEVSEETSRILLECAYFDPTTVRRTSKRHGVHSDSSHRFERGIDPGSVETFTRRAVSLLARVQEEATGSGPAISKGEGFAGSGPRLGTEVELDPKRASRLLGVDLSADDCRMHLERIGVDVEHKDDRLQCTIPTHRGDLGRPIDLVEEVARLHGYDEIPTTLPAMVAGARHRLRKDATDETIVSKKERADLDWLRGYLLDQGLREAVNYSFMGDDDLDRLRLGDDDCRRLAARVANPLVKSQARMRTTLIPALLDNVQTNFAQRRHDIALFEIGRRYFSTGEVRTLGIVVTGDRLRHYSGDVSWDFFDLKGIVESLVTPWAIDGAEWERPQVNEPYLHPGVQAAWICDGTILAHVGRLHPAVAQDEGLEQPLYFAEVDLEAFIASGPRRPMVRPSPKYPAVVRDFALLYDEDRPYGELRRAIDELVESSPSFADIFETMELFDVYEGPQVPEGRRSLAIKVTYRSGERTLEDSQVEAGDRQLLSHLSEKVGAELR